MKRVRFWRDFKNEWVNYEDVKKLEQENMRLKNRLKFLEGSDHGERVRLEKENSRLRELIREREIWWRQ